MTDERLGLNHAHVFRCLDSWWHQIDGHPENPSIPMYRRALIAACAGANKTAARVIERGFFGISETNVGASP